MSEKSHSVLFRVIFILLTLAIIAALINCSVRYAVFQKGTVTEIGLRQHLSENGWEVGELIEKTDIVIPATFSDVYEKYNDLQKSQGYDLSKYRTLTAAQFSFKIKNLTCPNGKIASDAVAHILVYGNRIIGGDICSYELDGCLVGIEK